MDSPGKDKERMAPNPNAPVFFAMAQPKGGKASQEDKTGKKAKGKSDGTTLKGKVHQWSEVGLTGKATDEENKQPLPPLHYTMESYEKEKNRKPLFEPLPVKKEEVEIEQKDPENRRWGHGEYCGYSRRDKGKGKNVDDGEKTFGKEYQHGHQYCRDHVTRWGPTSISTGADVQLTDRQKQKGKGGCNQHALGGLSAEEYKNNAMEFLG